MGQQAIGDAAKKQLEEITVLERTDQNDDAIAVFS